MSDRECELDAKAARLAAQAKRREAKGKGGSRPGSGSGTGPAATSDRARLSAALFGELPSSGL